MIKIELKFDDDLEVLAGNDFGKSVFNGQLKNKFDMNDMNELVFPDKIDMICSSFVQGLFYEYLNKYPVEEIEKHIYIANENHKEDVIEGLR